MSQAVEEVVAKPEMLKEEKTNDTETMTANGANGKESKQENGTKAVEEEPKKDEVPLQLEPKSGVSFPVKLDDGMQLNAAGLRKKSMFGMGIKVYGFGTIFLKQTLFSIFTKQVVVQWYQYIQHLKRTRLIGLEFDNKS